MIKYSASFFTFIFFIPLLIQAMDQSRPIIIENQSFGRVMHVSNIKEIAFLGNDEIVVNRRGKKPLSITISSCEVSGFPSVFFQGCLTTDQSKKRALFSCHSRDYSGDGIRIKIYDPAPKTIVDAIIDLDGDACKAWPICFDEGRNKPTSILMQKGEPSSIVSYDYMTGKMDPEVFISELFNNDEFKRHQYVFDSLSQNKAIVSGGYSGFRIDCESKSNLNKLYVTDSAYVWKNYLCNSGMSFIAHYSSMAQDVAGSHSYSEHALTRLSGCCIINVKTGDKTYLRYDKGTQVAPCSMEFHPNNDEVLVTMSAGDRIIEYWQAATGQLLAWQELPVYYKGEFEDEVGTFHKYLSFSVDGTLLAAVFPAQCVIFNVPFFIAHENKLIWILWCLKNYEINGNLLLKDIRDVLFNALKQ